MARRVGLLDHLEELRRRVLLVLVAVFLLSILAYPLTEDIILRIERDVLGEYAGNVIVTTPFEAVAVRMKLSLLLAGFFSIPLVAYEFLAFITPALRKKEKKWLIIVSCFSSLLFLAGAGFAYLILPLTMKILLDVAVPIAQPMLVLDELISFVIFFLAGVGLIFQWPLAAGMLTYLSILKPEVLSAYRKHAIVLCFVIAAVVTADTTFVSQVMLAIPMILLYEAGIITSKVVYMLKK